MIFKPAPCRSRWDGVAVCFWLALTNYLLAVWVGSRMTDWLRFVLIFALIGGLALLLHIIYRTWIAFSLEYWIDRNAITIRWADVRQTVPLSSIHRIISGGVTDLSQSRWVDWPAPFVREARPLGLLNVTSLATRSLEQCQLLDTGGAMFALAPNAPDAFLDAVQERLRMGPVANVTLERVRTADWGRILNTDRTGLALLAAGLFGAVLLFGALMVRYPSLPDVMTVRYTSEGIPDQVREKAALFLLPAIGLMSWLINGVWGVIMAARQHRTGAYLLWSGTLVVQLFILIALGVLIG